MASHWQFPSSLTCELHVKNLISNRGSLRIFWHFFTNSGVTWSFGEIPLYGRSAICYETNLLIYNLELNGVSLLAASLTSMNHFILEVFIEKVSKIPWSRVELAKTLQADNFQTLSHQYWVVSVLSFAQQYVFRPPQLTWNVVLYAVM